MNAATRLSRKNSVARESPQMGANENTNQRKIHGRVSRFGAGKPLFCPLKFAGIRVIRGHSSELLRLSRRELKCQPGDLLDFVEGPAERKTGRENEQRALHLANTRQPPFPRQNQSVI
jgi:hypothetical protein